NRSTTENDTSRIVYSDIFCASLIRWIWLIYKHMVERLVAAFDASLDMKETEDRMFFRDTLGREIEVLGSRIRTRNHLKCLMSRTRPSGARLRFISGTFASAYLRSIGRLAGSRPQLLPAQTLAPVAPLRPAWISFLCRTAGISGEKCIYGCVRDSEQSVLFFDLLECVLVEAPVGEKRLEFLGQSEFGALVGECRRFEVFLVVVDQLFESLDLGSNRVRLVHRSFVHHERDRLFLSVDLLRGSYMALDIGGSESVTIEQR
ncbi:hypothetical protein PMAYCL1PPCAC_21100, partial [Pristionchus mayeri]